MGRLILLLAVLLAAYLGLQKAGELSPEARRRLGRSALIALPLVGLALLIASGRLPWLAALLLPAGLVVRRLWQLAMMLTAARRFAGQVGAERRGDSGPGSAGARGDDARPSSGRAQSAEVQEAYAVLGLHEGATREEILEAHKRLILKLHPDHGGSDYLAARINRARDALLQRVSR